MSELVENTSLRIYMNEVCKTDLLTEAQEHELAERIMAGDEKAREQMIKANLRLVVKIATDYQGYGMPLSDLISEGNIGLMKAVERFVPDKGARLSTYSAWWIKQSIKRALSNQNRTVRLPIHMLDKAARLKRITKMLAEQIGRTPTDQELSDELGVPRRKIAMLKQFTQHTYSLDAPVEDGDTTSFGDTLGDEKTVDPASVLMTNNINEEVADLFNVLDERETRILEARFGLKGTKPMTLEEIGYEFGVTRERIRQVQNAALTKMKKILKHRESPAQMPKRKEA